MAAAASIAVAGCDGDGIDRQRDDAASAHTRVDANARGAASAANVAGYRYPLPLDDAQAARFLLQAQFSASPQEIAELRAIGYRAWLDRRFDAPPAQTAWAWVDSWPFNAVGIDSMVWRQLIAAPDAMRQRLALALSEIFVVSANDLEQIWWSPRMMAQYWDLLVGHIGGNFRALLEAVTLNPAMGIYLNTRGNRKADAGGRQPDENFAREVMQLFTIGLHQLQADGTPRLDPQGRPLEAYTQRDVSQLARVFTGYDLDIRKSERLQVNPPGTGFWIETADWTTRPMKFDPAQHESAPASFLGVDIAAGTPGPQALQIALDALFLHPNVGPFIGRQLIQRLVVSNPSPAYVARVAAAFDDNGAGVRGDLRAVFAAVLLDDEARGPEGLNSPTFGRLREPMLRLVQWARSFGARSAAQDWRIGDLSDAYALGQSPLRAPSVFNFFRPGYTPPATAIAAQGLVAPEFQIVDEIGCGAYINFLHKTFGEGLARGDIQADYASVWALALDPAALVRRLDLILTGGQLSPATLAAIAAAAAVPALDAGSPDSARLNRIRAAVLLTMAAPEYLVQK
ncbi:DUF1800 family protein [Lysobacter enzymogenes]|uniref:DUF1800 domain-containing protein n=1 Tax=Lysobacter enzymogenes TaxID=69 RepID=UPI00384FF296